MLPSFFIAHGSPMLAVTENAYTKLLRDLGRQMSPAFVLLFSAHWVSRVQRVSAVAQYQTIHDFYGFPGELYQIGYPARGGGQVAAEIEQLLAAEGIAVARDGERGLDHGAWVVLRLLCPDAGWPVVALSVNPAAPPAEHYAIGKALSALRARDGLIIGSGGTVHNFGTMHEAPEGHADPWAVQFDDWLTARMAQWDLESLFAYEALAPNAHLAVPPGGSEHFAPLYYAMGAADNQRVVRELYRGYEWGNLSHAVWQFGGP